MQGVLELLMAYPVHIMTLIGCILLFVLILPKRRRHRSSPLISTEQPVVKKGLTENEKQLLAEKIRDTQTENLKKSFAGEDTARYKIFVTIGLILLTVFFVILAIKLEFRKY